MKKQPKRILIKLGGASLSQQSTLAELIGLIRGYRQQNIQVVLVHGGGPAINEELTRRGISWQFINGQRQTTPEMMEVINEVLAKTVNRTIVTELSAARIPAVPYSGSLDSTLLCVQASAELMQVGEVVKVNTDRLESLLALDFAPVPVVAPIGVSGDGEKFNINADWAATKLACALAVDELLFLTDQNGILDENKDLISSANPKKINELIETGVIHGGMFTKVKTMMFGLDNGISQVRVIPAARASEIFRDENMGTRLVPGSFVVENKNEKVNSWKQELI